MDIQQARLYELWEYCENLQSRIFNLERTIQLRLAKGHTAMEEKEEATILREHLKRARYRAENFGKKQERHWEFISIEPLQ